MGVDATEQMQLIGMLSLWLNAVAQVILLVLQLNALKAYGHVSFLRLSIGSGFLLASVIAITVPMLITLEPAQWIVIEWIGLVLSAVGVPVALWGTATLFRQYGQLYRAAQSASSDRAP